MTKVVSDSPWLVDFAIGLVDSVLYYPNGQVKVFNFKRPHKISVQYLLDSGKTLN